MSARQLPIVTINGKAFFQDDRLQEYRAVDNPHERVTYDDAVELERAQRCGRTSAQGARVFVELVRIHAQEEYAVALGNHLCFVGVACNGAAGVLDTTLDWNRTLSPVAEAQAIQAVLTERRKRPPTVPSWHSCRCGSAR